MKITVDLEPAQATVLLRYLRQLVASEAQHTLGSSDADLTTARDALCLALEQREALIVAKLVGQREALINRAAAIYVANELHFGAVDERGTPPELREYRSRVSTLRFDAKECADEFRALLVKELRSRLGKIDDELRKLGAQPSQRRAS
jgi:hypothetical protein